MASCLDCSANRPTLHSPCIAVTTNGGNRPPSPILKRPDLGPRWPSCPPAMRGRWFCSSKTRKATCAPCGSTISLSRMKLVDSAPAYGPYVTGERPGKRRIGDGRTQFSSRKPRRALVLQRHLGNAKVSQRWISSDCNRMLNTCLRQSGSRRLDCISKTSTSRLLSFV